MNHAVLIASAVDDTNRPLAIVTVVVSTLLIIGAVVYMSRKREDPSTIDEGLLHALDSIEWYATDVGDDLVAAEPQTRVALVNETSQRIEGAHAQLIEHAPVDGDSRWEQLVVELTAAEAAYHKFAEGESVDPGSVAQHQDVLGSALERFRSQLA